MQLNMPILDWPNAQNTSIDNKQAMVAPWPQKVKKLVKVKISTDPSYIWSTDSKTVFK